MDSQNIRRWLLLGGAFAVTLFLVWQSPREEMAEEVVQAKRTQSSLVALPAGSATESGRFALAVRTPAAEEYIDLFAPHVTRAPRMAVERVEPPRPMPPPLPFKFVGKMVEEGQVKVFLQEGETLHSVAEGEMLGRNYRVLGIDDGRINLLYLPLNMTQTISVGNRLE